MYLFFVVCNITFDFFVSPAFGAGVPIFAGFNGRGSDVQGFRGKIPQALQGEDDFPRNPKGLTLQVR